MAMSGFKSIYSEPVPAIAFCDAVPESRDGHPKSCLYPDRETVRNFLFMEVWLGKPNKAGTFNVSMYIPKLTSQLMK